MGVAVGAFGFLLTEKDGLKLVSALFAAVFENRHRVSNQFQEMSTRAGANSLTPEQLGVIKTL
jgi:hypothetical protein